MAKRYQIMCDDGFEVDSKDKEEVMEMTAMHYLKMHPEEKINIKEMKSMVMEM